VSVAIKGGSGLIMVIIIVVIFIILLIVVSISIYLHQEEEKEHIKEQVHQLANNNLEMTPEEFFEMRKKSFGGRGLPSFAQNYNFSGVYIIYNSTKKMYYVGQTHKIFDRVNAHFTGKGNGDVYADYKYGDKFTIKMISLKNSGFKTLNALERNTIMTYDAFATGYNKTRGNK